MGWETRHGKRFYYQKERIGERVVSRYVGDGETADLISKFSALRREDARERLDEIAAEVAAMEAEDRAADALFTAVDDLMREALQAEGFHLHARSEWRKKRNGKAKDETKNAGATACQKRTSDR